MAMDQSRREAIAAALNGKGASKPCSRCGGTQLEIVGETLVPIQEQPGTLVIGGPSILTVIVACTKCGHIWQHALGPLGLPPR